MRSIYFIATAFINNNFYKFYLYHLPKNIQMLLSAYAKPTIKNKALKNENLKVISELVLSMSEYR